MGTDTTESATLSDVATTSRNFRIPDEVHDAAQAAAKAENEKVPAVIIRALRAYAADPGAFNIACLNIIREGKR